MNEVINLYDQRERTKKRSKLIMRKKVLKESEIQNFSYLFKHKDCSSSTANEQKQENSILKLFIKEIYCFRTIKSIVRTKNMLSLKLKEIQNQRSFLSQHVKQFESSNQQLCKKFGQYLKSFDDELRKKSQMYSRTSLNEQKSLYEKQLYQILQNKKDAKYVCFYYEPTAKALNFSQVHISTKLLQELGHDSAQFCEDFLKYKHLFLQMFDLQFLQKLISLVSEGRNNVLSLSSESQAKKHDNKQSQKSQEYKLRFDDFIFRTVKKESTLIEQKLPARFILSKPRVNITMIEVEDFDTTNIIESKIKGLDKLKQKIKKDSEDEIEKQVECMKKLMHQNLSISEENKKILAIKK